MGSIPNIIEAAIVLLVIFLIGCIIGWILRSKVFRRKTSANAVLQVPKSVPDPAPKTISETAKPPVEQDSAVEAPAVVAPAKTKTSAPKPRKAKISVVASQKAKTIKSSTPKPDIIPQSSTTKSQNITDSDKPAGLGGPREGKKDDLKKIKGVGPKLENTLNGLGIYHFDQIAKWNRQEIDWVDDFLSFKGRIDRDEWIAQAKKMS